MTVTLENKWRAYYAKVNIGEEACSLEVRVKWEESGHNAWLLESDKGGSPGIEELLVYLKLIQLEADFAQRTENLVNSTLSVFEAGMEQTQTLSNGTL